MALAIKASGIDSKSKKAVAVTGTGDIRKNRAFQIMRQVNKCYSLTM